MNQDTIYTDRRKKLLKLIDDPRYKQTVEIYKGGRMIAGLFQRKEEAEIA